MKIAIHNIFIGQKAAENELSRRICLAANNLGWEAIEVNSAVKINEFSPDFVLITHHEIPKLSKFPTYGCMWNPPVFIDKYENWLDELNKEVMSPYGDYPEFHFRYTNILSCDAYLSSSSQIDEWLNSILHNTTKQFFITPFFTSCNQTEYITPNIQEPRLIYMGTNWDGSRFKQLFQSLDKQDFMDVYGSNWGYLKYSYRGVLPYDGISVLKALSQAGVGLCLHKPEHTQSETPSMRIFEIVASGAVAICGEHKFIREAFGNQVLYIDTSTTIPEQIQQISNHIEWIKNHQTEALEMSRAAHDIFLEKYTLEKLLAGIVPHHQKLIKEKGFIQVNTNEQIPLKQVQFIVRVGDRSLAIIKRCLDSIVNQTYKNVAVILVRCKEVDGLSNFLDGYKQIIPIKIVNSEYTGHKSTQLQDGINAITSEYFAILNDTATIHPNHSYLLISLLEKYKFAGVAYSGSIRVWEDSNNLKVKDHDLVYFEDFDIKKIAKFQNFITSNSFISRSSFVSNFYKEDPKLDVAEDFYLLLYLCSKSIFIFSCEATSEFYWHGDTNDNINLSQIQNFETLLTANRLKTKPSVQVINRLSQIFDDQDFICIENLDLNQEVQPKFVKFSELRYTKSEKPLRADQELNSFSFYKSLRTIYLRLSRGGKFNKKPNSFSKFLVFIKQLLLE
jgi:hypothetical protein